VLLHSQLVFTPGVPIHLPEAEDLPASWPHRRRVVDASGQTTLTIKSRTSGAAPALPIGQRFARAADTGRAGGQDVTHEKSSGRILARSAGIKRPCGHASAGALDQSRPAMKQETAARAVLDLGFCFLFLAHAAAIFRFSERDAPAPWSPPSRPFFYLSLRREVRFSASRN